MLCSLITHPEHKEMLYFPSERGVIKEVPDELVKMVQECPTDRVQQVLNYVFYEVSRANHNPS